MALIQQHMTGVYVHKPVLPGSPQSGLDPIHAWGKSGWTYESAPLENSDGGYQKWISQVKPNAEHEYIASFFLLILVQFRQFPNNPSFLQMDKVCKLKLAMTQVCVILFVSFFFFTSTQFQLTKILCLTLEQDKFQFSSQSISCHSLKQLWVDVRHSATKHFWQ